MNIKEQLILDLGIEGVNVSMLASVPKAEMGDYSLPCFVFAKQQGRPPVQIAQELANKIEPKGIVEKVSAVGPYLNIWLNKTHAIMNTLNQITTSGENYGRNNMGVGKTICIDFSSVTLSKHLHIGHLCTTVIGAAIARLLKFLGYNVISINYIGDYGTPFGKLVAAYKHWGDKATIDREGEDAIQDLYVKFDVESKKDPSLLDEARDWYKKIEDGDEEATKIYKWFVEIGIKEAQVIYNKLGITFDSWRGESYYSKQTDDVINMLREKGLLKRSQGALIVDLEPYKLGACLIEKSDGTSLYVTRDIAAAMDRYQNYHFDESLYVTDTAQKLHFAQWMKVTELCGFEWASNQHHVAYGRLSTPAGKISGRRGNVPVLKDIFEQAEAKANEIVKDRNIDSSVAEAVAVSAISFGLLKTERIKDCVFNIDAAMNFDGETSTYLQYTNARICSLFEKAKNMDLNDVDFTLLNNTEAFELARELDNFTATLVSARTDYELCYLARYAISIATLFNRFYNNHKIITEDVALTKANLLLTKCTQNVLTKCMQILGVKIINKM